MLIWQYWLWQNENFWARVCGTRITKVMLAAWGNRHGELCEVELGKEIRKTAELRLPDLPRAARDLRTVPVSRLPIAGGTSATGADGSARTPPAKPFRLQLTTTDAPIAGREVFTAAGPVKLNPWQFRSAE